MNNGTKNAIVNRNAGGFGKKDWSKKNGEVVLKKAKTRRGDPNTAIAKWGARGSQTRWGSRGTARIEKKT